MTEPQDAAPGKVREWGVDETARRARLAYYANPPVDEWDKLDAISKEPWLRVALLLTKGAPEGYKLVPREPTEKMKEHAIRICTITRGASYAVAWQAMYDAAPPPSHLPVKE